MKEIIVIMICCVFFSSYLLASHQVRHLHIGYKSVYFAGKTRQALAVNNQIPAPVLHFKKGDSITLYVHNHLHEGTAMHWHGLLVPWQMDGVEGISQTKIPSGGTFRYAFSLQQSGTYWYHAHAGLQEQEGLYGAFIIDPQTAPKYHYNKDLALVLSDWSNSNPDQILANLKKSGDYYSPRFPIQPSLFKFIHDYHNASNNGRLKLLDDYKMMQQMRMSIYDLNDVAFDAYLLNGHNFANPWVFLVKKGDTVRLRFIGAAGNTIYRVKIPGSTMQMVHVEGNDVSPYEINDFTIAPGETYDVLVKIQQDRPYIIYAESRDKVGFVYGALITKVHQPVNYKQVKPFPEPLPVTRDMMAMMMGKMNEGTMPEVKMKHHASLFKSMAHSETMSMTHSMKMLTESKKVGDTIDLPKDHYKTSSDTLYQPIRAAVKTNDPNKPVAGVINMELFGYMDRFIWFINGLPAYKTHPILLESGKRYRIIFTNSSMMFHPMHIHGHWFILRKGDGVYDPLLHTINVPPGATITADVDTDASGQWFFHCHLLYHMVSGMSRIFQYNTLIELIEGEVKPQHIIESTNYNNRPIVRVDEALPIYDALVKHPMAHSAEFWKATFLDIGADLFHNVQRLTARGLYGYDYNKLELFANDAELTKGKFDNADIDIFYWHLISQFWAIKAGVNYFNRPALRPYWQLGWGIEGLMPWYIDTNLRTYYYNSALKLDLELSRDTQITNNFFIRMGGRSILASKNIVKAQIGKGINQMRYMIRPYYRLIPGFSVFIEYEYEKDYGAFKKMQSNLGELTTQNTLSFGFTALL